MKLKQQLRLIQGIYAELEANAESGDWAFAGDCAVRAQRMLTNTLLGQARNELDAESRQLLGALLSENSRLLQQAAGRRDQLRESGVQLRRNRQAVTAYSRACG